MTGHEIVKQLREMEQEATATPWAMLLSWKHIIGGKDLDRVVGFQEECNEADVEYIVEMRNSADLLLSIAEAFQPGDDELLRALGRHLFQMSGDLSGTELPTHILVTMLHRLQAAAEKLERE